MEVLVIQVSLGGIYVALRGDPRNISHNILGYVALRDISHTLCFWRYFTVHTHRTSEVFFIQWLSELALLIVPHTSGPGSTSYTNGPRW